MGPMLTDMIGKTAERVENIDNDVIRFSFTDGTVYEFYHDQDCCETVKIEDICGNLSDLEGVPLLMSEEVSSEGHPAPENPDDSYTWTFYKFGTIKGDVTVRWLGESNGFYSESVDFRRTA